MNSTNKPRAQKRRAAAVAATAALKNGDIEDDDSYTGINTSNRGKVEDNDDERSEEWSGNDEDDEDEYEDENKPKMTMKKKRASNMKNSTIAAKVQGQGKQHPVVDEVKSSVIDNSNGKSKSADVTGRKRKLRRKFNTDTYNDEMKKEDDTKSESIERLTGKGGYAHTNKSRLAISLANRGNTPHNKGKNWSNDIKSKIKASVQANVRKKMEIKLKALGLTEDEYAAKKKELKHKRELVRRRKVALKKVNGNIEALTKEWNNLNNSRSSSNKDEDSEVEKKGSDEQHQELPIFEQDTEGGNQSEKESEEKDKKEDEEEVYPDGEHSGNLYPTYVDNLINKRDMEWMLHQYDSDGAKGNSAVASSINNFDDTDGNIGANTVCPNNGNGGLICCEQCFKNYNSYMTQTLVDMETSYESSIKNEIYDLSTYIKDSTNELKKSINIVKVINPPLPSKSKWPLQQQRLVQGNQRFFSNETTSPLDVDSDAQRSPLSSTNNSGREDYNDDIDDILNSTVTKELEETHRDGTESTRENDAKLQFEGCIMAAPENAPGPPLEGKRNSLVILNPTGKLPSASI